MQRTFATTALLLALPSLLAGCEKASTPLPAPPVPEVPALEAEVAAAPTPPGVAEAPGETIDEQVRRIVREAGGRQRCNDLNGCPMVSTLVALGRKAAPALERAYRESRGDGFWRLRLLEALGRLRERAASPFLMRVLVEDRLPPARVEAALALARIKDKSVRGDLRTLSARLDAEAHLPVLLAVGYALAVLGDGLGRALIVEHLVVPEGKTLRWDRLRPGVFAVGQLRLKDLRGRVETIMQRADPFVRREAARALGALRDRASIPVLVEQLRDPVPGVRDEALRSLKALTGFRHKETYEQWSRWLAQERGHTL